MNEFIPLALCGLLGALLYAFPIALAALAAVPPGKYAWHSLAFSAVVGLFTAPIMVPLLGRHWPFLVVPEPYPLAVGVGLAINPVAPILIKRITGLAEIIPIGKTK